MDTEHSNVVDPLRELRVFARGDDKRPHLGVFESLRADLRNIAKEMVALYDKLDSLPRQ